MKKYLAAGIPSMFGFFGFPSSNSTNVIGGIPYPCPGEQAVWGHAIVAVGYDDAKKIKNTQCNKQTTGALLIRNSWGPSWGVKGYGWLPYPILIELAMVSIEIESSNASDPYPSFDPILNTHTRDIDTMRHDLENMITRRSQGIFKQMVDQLGLNGYSWSYRLPN